MRKFYVKNECKKKGKNQIKNICKHNKLILANSEIY